MSQKISSFTSSQFLFFQFMINNLPNRQLRQPLRVSPHIAQHRLACQVNLRSQFPGLRIIVYINIKFQLQFFPNFLLIINLNYKCPLIILPSSAQAPAPVWLCWYYNQNLQPAGHPAGLPKKYNLVGYQLP